ncbi:MAG: hypothetical protein LBH20_10565 [Treponema sp.]|jgi:putative transcriptional regulator|nr:hypothetical protein [Treponema sp.]
MKYKSEIYEVIHQDARANFEVGAISEAEMREFNEMCLVHEIDTSYVAEKSDETEYAATSVAVTH